MIRPERFRLNSQHPLAQGLVFAGLGNNAGSDKYYDSSLYGRHGNLTSSGWSSVGGMTGILNDNGDARCYVEHPVLSQSAGSVVLWTTRIGNRGIYATWFNVETVENDSTHEMLSLIHI